MGDPFHLHLISDATGETLHAVARASPVQFKGAAVMTLLAERRDGCR